MLYTIAPNIPPPTQNNVTITTFLYVFPLIHKLYILFKVINSNNMVPKTITCLSTFGVSTLLIIAETYPTIYPAAPAIYPVSKIISFFHMDLSFLLADS